MSTPVIINPDPSDPHESEELTGMKDGLVKELYLQPGKEMPIASDLTLRLAVDHGEDVTNAARPRNNVARYLPKSVDGPEYLNC